MTGTTESLLVTPEMLQIRLDRLLVQTFPHHSRTYFQYLIESGLVLVNGSPVKKRETVDLGDEIEVCFELTPELSLTPENIPLDILYEDNHLIAINKPAGMVTHPAPGHPTGTFVNALLYHCKTLPNTSDASRKFVASGPRQNLGVESIKEGGSIHSIQPPSLIAQPREFSRRSTSNELSGSITSTLRPGIVHRLDKDTSGVLIAAKTTECHQKLVELFSTRAVTKHYTAICVGNPGDRVINEPIRRHPTRRQEMHVDPAGKPATSICRVLKTEKELTWVDIQLITGRTHQIRVHLKHVGTPILGDPVYGRPSINEKYGIQRQLLHATTLSLVHPITSIPLHLVAPFPPDLGIPAQ
jgi:23S rRNA pseudouridine1911/1915/1917 synthase